MKIDIYAIMAICMMVGLICGAALFLGYITCQIGIATCNFNWEDPILYLIIIHSSLSYISLVCIIYLHRKEKKKKLLETDISLRRCRI